MVTVDLGEIHPEYLRNALQQPTQGTDARFVPLVSGSAQCGLRRLLALVLLVVVGPLAWAAPAGAAVGGAASPSFGCAATNGDGTFTYLFGYTLPAGAAPETVPVGEQNQFTPGEKDFGQPTTVTAEVHQNAFVVTTSRTGLTWHLGSNNLRVTATGNLCSNVPVVAEARSAVVLPLAGVAPFLAWFLVVRRRASRRQG